MELDPYTSILCECWAALENDVDFCSLVPPGNRVKFLARVGSGLDSEKQESITADRPEVRLFPAGGRAHTRSTSHRISDVLSIIAQIRSGDQRLDLYYLPLRWILFRVFTKISATLRSSIRYHGKSFVTICRLSSISEDLISGADGWVGMWSLDVECDPLIADL